MSYFTNNFFNQCQTLAMELIESNICTWEMLSQGLKWSTYVISQSTTNVILPEGVSIKWKCCFLDKYRQRRWRRAFWHSWQLGMQIGWQKKSIFSSDMIGSLLETYSIHYEVFEKLEYYLRYLLWSAQCQICWKCHQWSSWRQAIQLRFISLHFFTSLRAQIEE